MILTHKPAQLHNHRNQYTHHYQGFRPNKKSARQTKYFIKWKFDIQVIFTFEKFNQKKPNNMRKIFNHKNAHFTKTFINQLLNTCV